MMARKCANVLVRSLFHVSCKMTSTSPSRYDILRAVLDLERLGVVRKFKEVTVYQLLVLQDELLELEKQWKESNPRPNDENTPAGDTSENLPEETAPAQQASDLSGMFTKLKEYRMFNDLFSSI